MSCQFLKVDWASRLFA
uniref:Uncharacterized protein n=1 Tax=Rhizophora mucronata TaxID=61149 RepID=A0A2P2R1N0_RHIMU